MKIVRKTKKLVILTIALSFLILPIIASAQAPTADFGTDYANSGFGLGSVDLKTAIQSIVGVLLGFLGIIAVLIILYGGFIWMTAMGDEGKVDKAKKLLIAGVVGLVIILAAYALASFVINALSDATTN